MKMAQLIKIYEQNPNPREIDKAVAILAKGGLIIYPTDTVYGLGCDITNSKALSRLARIKGIEVAKANWSFICPDLSNLASFAKPLGTPEFKLLKRSLPGPYTFILEGSKSLPKDFKKKKTVGIRVPANKIALALVNGLGRPIVSTSIKDDDEVLEYTTDPSLIYDKWNKLVDLVIDGGPGGNIASTVIDLTSGEPEIIREGKGSLEIL